MKLLIVTTHSFKSDNFRLKLLSAAMCIDIYIALIIIQCSKACLQNLTNDDNKVLAAEDGKHSNCRHVRLNIHIGQLVINETVVDSSAEMDKIPSDRQESLNRYHLEGNEYMQLKLPLFKLTESKPRSNLSTDLLHSSQNSNLSTDLLHSSQNISLLTSNISNKMLNDNSSALELDESNINNGKWKKEENDSVNVKMIDEIVKNIVRKYKTKLTSMKSSNNIFQDSSCTCQKKEDSDKFDIGVNLYNDRRTPLLQLGTVNATLSPEVKEKIKQEVIDKVLESLETHNTKVKTRRFRRGLNRRNRCRRRRCVVQIYN